MSLAERVLSVLDEETGVSDDLLEYLFLLLEKEEQDEYPSFAIKPNELTDDYVDVYAYVIKYILDMTPKLADDGLTSTLESVLPLTREDIHEHSRHIPFEFRTRIEYSLHRKFAISPISFLIGELLNYPVKVPIPRYLRKEHTYILGNTGSGKTQLIQELISQDLKTNASIIVIDSQGDLINTLKHSKLIEPDRLVIIDPIDSVTYPLALNMFDIGDRKDLNPVELERHINGVVELLNFVFSAVMDSPLTDKQGVVFNFCIRLLLIIPDATLETLVHILEHGVDDYAGYVNKLPDVAKTFFFNSFHNRDYYQTRIQINRRLYSLLENPTISRLFKSPKNYLDISKEMDKGKVILISTDRSLLKRQGCAFFGRYFISLVAQAMQDRLNRPPEHRRKTYLYIDECGDYLQTEDVNITDILEKGRKYNVGVTLAHQQINQLPPDVFQAVKTNSAIKMIGTCSHSDSNALKYDMKVEDIKMSRLHFLTNLRGSHSFPIKVNVGLLENMEQRTEEEFEAIMVMNRAKYSIRANTPSIPVEKNEKNDEIKGIPKDPLSDYT